MIMSRIQQLQNSIDAYIELDRLADIAMKAVKDRSDKSQDIHRLINKHLVFIQQLDSELPHDLTPLENDPKASALLRKRIQIMQQILKKSQDNAANLASRKGIIGNELRNIRKGRDSIPAYKEAVQSSGRIIQNRY